MRTMHVACSSKTLNYTVGRAGSRGFKIAKLAWRSANHNLVGSRLPVVRPDLGLTVLLQYMLTRHGLWGPVPVPFLPYFIFLNQFTRGANVVRGKKLQGPRQGR